MPLRAPWPFILSAIACAAAFVGLVRVGASLDRLGLSYWIVVAAVCGLIGLSQWLKDSGGWFSRARLRHWLLVLAAALGFMGWAGGTARRETIQTGQVERLASVIMQGGDPAARALQSADDQTLHRLSDRFPGLVAAEMARRQTPQTRRLQDAARDEQSGALSVFQRVWYVFRQFIDFFRWLLHPRA